MRLTVTISDFQLSGYDEVKKLASFTNGRYSFANDIRHTVNQKVNTRAKITRKFGDRIDFFGGFSTKRFNLQASSTTKVCIKIIPKKGEKKQ